MSLPKPYYDDGEGIVIYHGDCREILPDIPAGSVDLVLTDPPYGINHASRTETTCWGEAIAGDVDTSVRDEVLSGFAEWACFASIKVPFPAGCRAVCVWDKGPAVGMGDLSFPFKPSWELICFRGEGWYGHRGDGVIKGYTVVTWASKGRSHPNEKPSDLMGFLLSKHPAKSIADPFMGSGSTLFAAKLSGIHAIGIEIEERYCEIAAKRLAQGVLEFNE